MNHGKTNFQTRFVETGPARSGGESFCMKTGKETLQKVQPVVLTFLWVELHGNRVTLSTATITFRPANSMVATEVSGSGQTK